MDNSITLVAYRFTSKKDIYLGLQQGTTITFYGKFFDKKSANEFIDILKSTVPERNKNND